MAPWRVAVCVINPKNASAAVNEAAVTLYQALSQRGIETGTDLQNFTPSLSVVGNTNRNQENYTIRGIGGIGSLGTGGGPGVGARAGTVFSARTIPARATTAFAL